MKEAKHFGEVVEIASSSDANFTFYPQVPNTVPKADIIHDAVKIVRHGKAAGDLDIRAQNLQ